MPMYNSKYFMSFAALAFASTASCLTVAPSNDATALAQALLGVDSGITLVSATYTGAANGAGLYTDGPQGLRNSIVLTTGDAVDVIPGPGTSDEISKSKSTAGSALCASLNGGVNTYDAAVLSMNVILEPGFDGFNSEFVFATEEYPEWLGSDFNDVFGIWVDGQQIAQDENGAPITINGPFFKSDSVLTPPASGSSMDGSTPILKSGHVAAPGAHKIEMAICDTGDRDLDSAVFVTLRGCNGDCKSGTVIVPTSPCAGKGGDTDEDGICDFDDNCPTVYNPDQDADACATTSSSSSSSSSTIVHTNTTMTPTHTPTVTPIDTPTNTPIVNTTPVVHTPTSSHGHEDSTITSDPTSSTEAPCVTYTSYVIKTITKCDSGSCHPTTTVIPTVVTSTLQLTVVTPCSTVTVSKCPGGPGSPCVTLTHTLTYPAITTYPVFTPPVGPSPTGPTEVPGYVEVPTGIVEVPTGPVKIPTGHVEIPTSPVTIPTGPATVPTGHIEVPTGHVEIPTGKVEVPTGHIEVPTGPVEVPTGVLSVPVSVPTGIVEIPTVPVSLPVSVPVSIPVAVSTNIALVPSGIIPTYTAPVSVPYGNGTHGNSTHGCPGGFNCPAPTPSAGFSIPVPKNVTSSTSVPTTVKPVTTPGSVTTPAAITPVSPATSAPVFEGAAARVSGMASAAVVGFVVAALAVAL